MIEVRKTEVFHKWMAKLRDRNARQRISVRIRRMELGNFGDAKSIGSGVSELRIGYGPGYRVYFTRQGKLVVVLLCGGNKSTQASDIVKAKAMKEEL